MKLHEVKQLEDGRVMLKNGYYMEPDLPRPSQGHKSWTIKQLMDDDTVVATAETVNSADMHSGDYTFYLETVSNKNKVSLRFRAPSYKMMLDHFYDWVEKGLKHMIKEAALPAKESITMLGDGFYLEEDPDDPRREPGIRSFGIKRLMQDKEVGEAFIISTEGDSDRGIWRVTIGDQKNSSRIGSERALYDLKEFGAWVRKHLRTLVGEDLFADARKARLARVNAAKPVKLVRLNKDGKESRMHDATSLFNTEAEAKAHHDQMVKSNPSKYIGHAMYSSDGELALRTELHDGRFGKVTRVERT